MHLIHHTSNHVRAAYFHSTMQPTNLQRRPIDENYNQYHRVSMHIHRPSVPQNEVRILERSVKQTQS